MHCNTCKCAQHDHCCRRAVKLHSFIHSSFHLLKISFPTFLLISNYNTILYLNNKQQQTNMSFDLDKFTAEPSVELLNLGKKTDLLNLAKHYKLSEIKSSMRKHEIKNILVHYFVDEKIFNENVLSLIVDVQSVSSSKELELKFQIRQLEIQEREKEREWKEREREREREREKREDREKEREFQLRMREIEMQERANQPKQKIEYNFDVTKHIRLVPPFQEIEVDKYFLHFEKVAENLNWPKEHWTLLLQSVLIGKAREIYIQLSVEQSQHYETV